MFSAFSTSSYKKRINTALTQQEQSDIYWHQKPAQEPLGTFGNELNISPNPTNPKPVSPTYHHKEKYSWGNLSLQQPLWIIRTIYPQTPAIGTKSLLKSHWDLLGMKYIFPRTLLTPSLSPQHTTTGTIIPGGS